MHGYEDDIDYDEYEEEEEQEGREEEEAEYEKEAAQPTKEELEYLELRQRLKESIRKKMKKGSAGSRDSQDSKGKLPYNDFGSFFGPSQPVIASRVIQESKSLLENPHLASRIINSSQASKKTASSHSTKSNDGSHSRLPRAVSEVKRKVEKLKDKRDYSFLFSGDEELPAPIKELPPRNSSLRLSEAQAAQNPSKPKQSLGISSRNAGIQSEEKKPASVNGRRHPTSSCSSSQMHSKSRPSGSQMHSRSGPSGSQMHLRPGPSGSQMHLRPGPSGSQVHSRSASSGSQVNPRSGPSSSQVHSRSGPSAGGQLHSRSGPSAGGQVHSRASSSQMHSKQSTANSQSSSRFASQNSAPVRKPDLSSIDTRKQYSSSNGVGPGRPQGAKPVPPKMPVTPMEKKNSVVATKNHLQGSQKSSSLKMSSDAKQRIEHRKVSHEPSRSQMIQRQSGTAAKPQTNKPLKRVASHSSVDDRRPKKKPMSEDEKALSMIRSMFRVDRYAGRDYDDDDSDMEANFEDIMREEQRSARIARKEDEEQLRLIEEEERQERMRKLSKKRKLGHR